MPRLGSGQPPAERFWAKVVKTDGCWLWSAGKDKDGYGKFQLNVPGRRQQIHVRAHRYAFFLANGRWPEPEVLHACDTPACVRPDHLGEGTRAQNRADTVARGREPRGSAKPNAIFNEQLVREARDCLSRGRGELAKLARRTGIHLGALHQAATRGWRHVS